MLKKNQNFLQEIVKIKREELSHKTEKKVVHEGQYAKNVKFLEVFQTQKNKLKIIAEIKFASPSNLHLGSRDDLLDRAKQYEDVGADVISLITERHFFKGDIETVAQVRKVVALPILQKDFIIDSKQIYEAKRAGSDALLLIARLVNDKQLSEFVSLCQSLHIEPVVEINNDEDLKKTITTNTNIIAVNARDLETLTVDISRACKLIEKIPDKFIKLGFSGVTSHKEVSLYKNSGVNGILVGTSLMQANDIKSFINDLKI